MIMEKRPTREVTNLMRSHGSEKTEYMEREIRRKKERNEESVVKEDGNEGKNRKRGRRKENKMGFVNQSCFGMRERLYG